MSYGNRFFEKSNDYKSVYKCIKKEYGKEKAKLVFKKAAAELDCILKCFHDIPKGERNHTNNYIFPRAAMYRTLSEFFGKEYALSLIDDAVCNQGEKMSNILGKVTALPFMKHIFLRIFSSMAKNMFGENNGFKQIFYESPKGTVKFDIFDCTYCRYCRLCGCPEIIETFCKTDWFCFGNLSKIDFKREQTLENGEKCDFELTVNKWRRK